MKNFALGALTIAVIILAGYLIYDKAVLLNQSDMKDNSKKEISMSENKKEVEKTESDKKLIGGDRDDYGCLIGAGYSWCEEKQKCLRTWEEECAESSKSGITGAMSEKYSKAMGDVTITISQEEGNYARGGVEFAPGGEGNVGMFLAVKINGQWKIVYDGHGVPNCTELKQTYNFPENMLQGMCD